MENCKFYMAGSCFFGETCKNNHPTTADGHPVRPGMPDCPFYMSGNCTKKTTCKYNHTHKGLSGLPDVVAAVAPAPKVALSKPVDARRYIDI
jgi:hypothetical protein